MENGGGRLAGRRTVSRCTHALLGLGLVLTVQACGTPSPARAAFELLPGPAAGGLADWAWSGIPASAGFQADLSLGSPAALRDLGWTHARGIWRGRHAHASVEGFLLALDDLYREESLGVWTGLRGAGVGLRRWRVAWQDGTRRSGLTIGAQAIQRIRGLTLEMAVQDLSVGGADRSAPRPRVSLGAGLTAGRDLSLGLSAYRSDRDAGGIVRLSWAPIDGLVLYQTIHYPKPDPRSGLGVASGRANFSLWIEPSPMIGPRIGLTCSLRAR